MTARRVVVALTQAEAEALSVVASLILNHDPDLKDRIGARGLTKAWSAYEKLRAAAWKKRATDAEAQSACPTKATP